MDAQRVDKGWVSLAVHGEGRDITAFLGPTDYGIVLAPVRIRLNIRIEAEVFLE